MLCNIVLGRSLLCYVMLSLEAACYVMLYWPGRLLVMVCYIVLGGSVRGKYGDRASRMRQILKYESCGKFPGVFGLSEKENYCDIALQEKRQNTKAIFTSGTAL